MTEALRLQMASTLLMMFLIINYCSVKRRKTQTHKLFFRLLILAFVNTLFDYAYVFLFETKGWNIDILNRLYLITLALLLINMEAYISVSIRNAGGRIPISDRFWYVVCAMVVMCVIIMRVEYTDIGGWYYSSGVGITILHVYLGVMLALCIFLVAYNYKRLNSKKIIAIILAVFSQGVVYIIQLFATRDIITSLGNAMMIVSFYVISENPDQLLIERLEFERDRANVANATKSSFIAHISHEIRTPINAILGMNEMIIRESKEEQSRQYAADISQAAQTLYSIINDVLDISKIESGKLEIIPIEYKLDQMLYDTVSAYKPRIDAKKLDFIIDINPTLPNTLYGDDVHIKQVISNLLSNATKYTHEGFIKLSVNGEFKGDMVDLFFEIKDTGIGIKEEDIEKLFEAFERIEESRNRNIEGTGLGMTITNSLLKLMGSRLGVNSVYGEGSIFSFTLTQRIVSPDPIGNFSTFAKQQEAPEEIAFTAPSVKVLVVDDNSINRRVFRSLLARTQIMIDEADSGSACLNMIQEEQYDMIFLDHLMPGMDGIETVEHIKADNTHKNVSTPIVMLTANTMGNAAELYKQSGFDAYLPKPIFVKELEKVIKTYVPSYKLLYPARDSQDKKLSSENWQEELPSVRGIDWDEAVKHLPSADILFTTVSEFRAAIDTEAALLDEYFANIHEGNNLQMFQIKTHALKSSSALIGADMLSEGARELESAAREKDYRIINEKYPYMINYYRTFKDRLAFFDSEDTPKKEEIDFPQVLALVEMVRLEINDMNRQNALDAIAEIEVYKYPPEIQEDIVKLKKQTEDYDSAAVGDTVDRLLVALRALRDQQR
ncbi:MAG: response regulator [Lachnospiraceae bacterium]|nr:response regulator [Lachnospiraceae bacterium]